MLRVSIVAGALVGALLVPGAASASGLHPSARDHDGDGLTNVFEKYKSHTNPWKVDTNHNGVRDGKENPDHDGLTNRQEQTVGTNPLKGDTNHNGVKDGQEDADHDGLDNHQEFQAGTNPEDADTDNDGVEDGQEDSDHDGVDNETEQEDGTNPGDADTDDDGVKDGEDGDANGDGHDDQCEDRERQRLPALRGRRLRARRGRGPGLNARPTDPPRWGRADVTGDTLGRRPFVMPVPQHPCRQQGSGSLGRRRRGIVVGHMHVAPDAPHLARTHHMTQLAEHPATTHEQRRPGQPLDRWLHRRRHVRPLGRRL